MRRLHNPTSTITVPYSDSAICRGEEGTPDAPLLPSFILLSVNKGSPQMHRLRLCKGDWNERKWFHIDNRREQGLVEVGEEPA
jgi:hypothetical protein